MKVVKKLAGCRLEWGKRGKIVAIFVFPLPAMFGHHLLRWTGLEFSPRDVVGSAPRGGFEGNGARCVKPSHIAASRAGDIGNPDGIANDVAADDLDGAAFAIRRRIGAGGGPGCP